MNGLQQQPKDDDDDDDAMKMKNDVSILTSCTYFTATAAAA